MLLDASAVIALLKDEPGAAVVIAALEGSTISAVNLTEVLGKLLPGNERAGTALDMLNIPVLPFTDREAAAAGRLLNTHRGVLSLGDAACLATAHAHSLPVLTADRAWTALDIGLDIRLIRP
jgi:ribonuclease VapC